MVPASSVAMMAVCALVGIVAPVALAWWLVRKYHARLITILAAVPAETREQVEGQFTKLQDLNAGQLLLGLWERISALILQLGLSVIVWTAVRKGSKWLWLFPAAILLHALVDGCAVVLSKSVSASAVETIIFSMAIAIGAAGCMLAKKL